MALALFVYLSVLRTRHISETFWLLGDQILYWRIALGPWQDLPIGGGPSSVGGTTLGPAFVWAMWLIAQLVGPFTGRLPHAGGVGLSLIQSAADALLLLAVWRRFRSLPLALGVILLAATAPYDMALSATIWNPPLSVAFVKTAIALVLLGDRAGSIWWGAGATAAAMLAVQAHSSAVFFAAPVMASFPARELLARRPRRALQVAAASAAVLLVLETPLLIDWAAHPERSRGPGIVVRSVSYTLEHPEVVRPAAAFGALAEGLQFILLRPLRPFAWFGAVLAACAALTAFRTGRELALFCVTVLPLLCAVGGFSLWQAKYDHYWFLTVAPSATLTVGLALTAWRPAAPYLAALLAAAMVVVQPWRLADAMTIHRLPEYAPLVRGSQEIRRRTPEVRGIETEFPLPPTADPQFIYEVLGGRVTPSAPFAASIGAGGQVRFTAQPIPGAAGDSRPTTQN